MSLRACMRNDALTFGVCETFSTVWLCACMRSSALAICASVDYTGPQRMQVRSVDTWCVVTLIGCCHALHSRLYLHIKLNMRPPGLTVILSRGILPRGILPDGESAAAAAEDARRKSLPKTA